MDRRASGPPIGITVANVARDVSRAFDDALGEAGGSRPEWLVLMALKNTPTANQRELAAQVGIQGATLTHHLNAMEHAGLVSRRRDPGNRRVHIVEITGKGEQAFRRMVGVVTAFDKRLRSGLSDNEIAELRGLLSRLHRNVNPDVSLGSAPVAEPPAVFTGETACADDNDSMERRPSDND